MSWARPACQPQVAMTPWPRLCLPFFVKEWLNLAALWQAQNQEYFCCRNLEWTIIRGLYGNCWTTLGSLKVEIFEPLSNPADRNIWTTIQSLQIEIWNHYTEPANGNSWTTIWSLQIVILNHYMKPANGNSWTTIGSLEVEIFELPYGACK